VLVIIDSLIEIHKGLAGSAGSFEA
jgi:hypothetical protein